MGKIPLVRSFLGKVKIDLFLVNKSWAKTIKDWLSYSNKSGVGVGIKIVGHI